MKIVLAPDSFKGSLGASQVAAALENGIHRVLPNANCVKLPMADGGEGLVETVVQARAGRIFEHSVTGPMGVPVTANIGLIEDGKTAVLEAASACGLGLISASERNPLLTTSYGVGELIAIALSHGAERIIVGLGGSATNDGGAGMAQALGVQFYNDDGNAIEYPLSGGALPQIDRIALDQRVERLSTVEIIGACDVNNRLTGAHGATATFAPQKGAHPAQVHILESALNHLGSTIERCLGVEVFSIRSGGAAGGLGAGLFAFAGGHLVSGIELVSDLVDLPHKLHDADLVITGEGSIDSQTLSGKTPAGVAAAASRAGVPVVAVGGRLAGDAHDVFAHNIDALESAIVRDMDLSVAIENAERNLQDAGERIGRWLILGERLSKRNNRHLI